MTRWGPWQPRQNAFASPYVDWEIDLMERLGLLADMEQVLAPAVVVDTPLDFHILLADEDTQIAKVKEPPAEKRFPVPKYMANPDFQSNGHIGVSDPLAGMDKSMVTDKTVIVGVIDVDVGIGHSRFRTSCGASRVLASWQQGADWHKSKTASLPFGAELIQPVITDLLRDYGARHVGQPWDQDGFYRAAGLLQHGRLEGAGVLGRTAAHGTHVLGLAAGADPLDLAQQDFRDDVRMLVVNLPHPSCFGEGGAFLDYYLTYGLRWIVQTNRNIAMEMGRETPLPLFINVSFGKQAGARNEDQTLVAELKRLKKANVLGHDRTFSVLLPAGNDNLERCHAEVCLTCDPQELEWRIQPDDGTSNFVEIWVENLFSLKEIKEKLATKVPLLIDVIAPGSPETETTEPSSKHARDMTDRMGRIYCDWVTANGQRYAGRGNSEDKKYRLRYLICLAPNAITIPGTRPPRAGRYRIKLISRVDQALQVVAKVQTDEATVQTFRNAKRSYFEDANYRMFEWEGRMADTYLYTPGPDNKVNLDRDESTIKRHGTMNSYASVKSITAIAGYRASDGRPAPYSGSGIGVRSGPVALDEDRRGAPTVALPSDDGYAHFGVLSDGAQDGSVVAMQGTSFACATATRFAVEAYLQDRRKGRAQIPAWKKLNKAAKADAENPGWMNARVDIEKAGAGRVVAPPGHRVNRMGDPPSRG